MQQNVSLFALVRHIPPTCLINVAQRTAPARDRRERGKGREGGRGCPNRYTHTSVSFADNRFSRPGEFAAGVRCKKRNNDAPRADINERVCGCVSADFRAIIFFFAPRLDVSVMISADSIPIYLRRKKTGITFASRRTPALSGFVNV